MGYMKTHELIQDNLEVVRRLIKIGAVPPTYLTYLNIYVVFVDCKKLGSKRKREFYTADVTKTSVSTVQRAIKVMESPAPN
jgi:hypothetical protein